MKTSIIITTYNWPEALKILFKSIQSQTVTPYEVIVADDGSKDDTKNLIESFKKDLPCKLHHVWHEDRGFRASEIRNKAIVKSSGDYLIFIDGDMILHPKFINDHISVAKEGFFTQGSRVITSKKLGSNIISSKKYSFSLLQSGVKNRKNLIRCKFLKTISLKTNKGPLDGIRTCNLALYKDDLLKVNGFNESFQGWGREDSELIVRIMNSGVKRQNLKFAAPALHVYHPENSRKMLEINEKILKFSIDKKLTFIENGMIKS